MSNSELTSVLRSYHNKNVHNLISDFIKIAYLEITEFSINLYEAYLNLIYLIVLYINFCILSIFAIMLTKIIHLYYKITLDVDV